jgi:hypothetical protein
VQKILHSPLKLYAYKIQIVQAIDPDDQSHQKEFAVDMFRQIGYGSNFLDNFSFSDESTFPVSGKINRYHRNIRDS